MGATAGRLAPDSLLCRLAPPPAPRPAGFNGAPATPATFDAPLLFVVAGPLTDEALEAGPLAGALVAENLPPTAGLFVVLDSPLEDPLPVALLEAVGTLLEVLWVGPLLAWEGAAPLPTALRGGALLAAALGAAPLLTALRAGPLLLAVVVEGVLPAADAAGPWLTVEPAGSLPVSTLLELLLR